MIALFFYCAVFLFDGLITDKVCWQYASDATTFFNTNPKK